MLVCKKMLNSDPYSTGSLLKDGRGDQIEKESAPDLSRFWGYGPADSVGPGLGWAL